MTELDRSLGRLASEVDWPATPDVASRLELAPRRRGRRPVVLAIALALLALAVALAVPDARSSILRFLHIGGVTIERVSTLPAAEERPLAADLGPQITPEAAELVLGTPFLLPEVAGRPVLHQSNGIVAVLLAMPEPVLLTETRFTGLMKKLSASSTGIERVEILPGVNGVWISGARHVFFEPQLPPRLAGNVLLWDRGQVTFRVEGRTVTRDRALELARQILR